MRRLLFWMLAILPGAAFGDPVEILRAADRARGSLEGVAFDMTIVSVENGRTSEMRVHVQARGFDFLCEELEPPKYKGQKLLLVSGNMWFSKPGLSKPIAISQRQRLMGQAAHGDIAATNYADEYDATVVGEETVGGEFCHLFDLQARTKKATYDRIRYWVSKERTVGVKAEYFTVSGKLIKTARMEYENRSGGGVSGGVPGSAGVGRPFISKIVITDALNAESVTTMTFIDPKFPAIPPETLTLDRLSR